jgi:hypothetical protein
MGNERVVVVREQKRGGFWPFVGGLALGVLSLWAINKYQKSKEESQKGDFIDVDCDEENHQPNLDWVNEVKMTNDLIEIIKNKVNLSQKEKGVLKSLENRLEELYSEF